jgi:mannose/fructose/N-acetylgalactosamine-specific phosphotransferase system component IIC
MTVSDSYRIVTVLYAVQVAVFITVVSMLCWLQHVAVVKHYDAILEEIRLNRVEMIEHWAYTVERDRRLMRGETESESQ